MSEQTVSDLHPGPYGLFVPPHQVSEPASSAVPEDAAAAPAGPVLATVFCPGGKFTKVGWGTFVGLFTRWEFTWASGVAGVVDEYLIGVPGGYSRYPVQGGHFGMIVPQ